jgi:hypothetical protein
MNYLSFGAGVNSTALMVLLRREGIEFEAIFADTGSEWPETYQHINWLQSHGWPITIIPGMRDGLYLYDYAWQHTFLPSRHFRWCTHWHKMDPIYSFAKPPGTMILGIDAGEKHRANYTPVGSLDRSFPLVEAGIDRKGCEEIIRAAGIPMPRKSGCYICPFQRRGQWMELREKHPQTFARALALENHVNEFQVSRGKTPYYLAKDRPLLEVVEESQLDMFGWREPLVDLSRCSFCEVSSEVLEPLLGSG